LFLASSLFILGAGMLALRVIPLIVRLVYALTRRALSPGLYASFTYMLRARDRQGFIMLFLIVTVALGIFNAQTARTVNTGEEERIRYLSGADIVLREKWMDNAQAAASADEIEYYEPDFNRFVTLDGVRGATKVLDRQDIVMQLPNGSLGDVRVLGIHTKEFGEISHLKEGLLQPHYFKYLNAIAQNARAVLLSSNFQELYGLDIGDVVYFKRKSIGPQIRGVVYGFVDYFPTYSRFERKTGTDGRLSEKENFLIVANFSQLQADWGILPYDVWIAATDSTQFMYEYIDEQALPITKFLDQGREIVKMKNDPVMQGTNGILTVGFIVILLLCSVGFLIYWILSIQSRQLQFGIFRAMGMSVREVVGMLINEQVFLSGLSILAGALIGVLAARLYIPLLQITYAAADRPIPLEIVSASQDMRRLFDIIGVMIALCLAVLGAIVKNIRISQTLKLGEDS
jgi:putative ABC transport system permease protein